jgi:hypothetical protein
LVHLVQMLSWTNHPLLPVPSKEEMLSMGENKLLEFHRTREEAILREKEDPYRHGYEPPNWSMVDDEIKTHNEILLMGGNRAGKTELFSKRVVECVCKNPNTVIWCLTENMQNSIQVQQKAIYKYLPKEYKHLGRSKTGYVVFSIRNGFTAGKFSLPNGSQVIFRNWSQDLSTVEGGEIGVPTWENGLAEGTHNIGFWADELIPLSWLETLRFRTITRGASGLVSFTAVTGWSPTVKSLLAGATTTKWGKAELLDNEKVPLVQQPTRSASVVVYFHTKDNPYGGWAHMKKQLSGENRDTILCRAYGVPTKSAQTVFAKFGENNIRSPKDIPILEDPVNNPAIWLTIVDPAGAKPWFILHLGIDAHGTYWVVDEFPCFEEEGLWYDPARGDRGRPGDGARANGFGISDYVGVIKTMEKGRDCIRYVDPRLGNATYQKAEGTSNIIDDLNEAGIVCYPAEGLDIETGVQSIQSLLAWDQGKPMDLTNRPRLMVSSRCRNLIICMENWPSDGNLKHGAKDPIDCLRYGAIMNHEYYSKEDMIQTGTGGY